MACRLAFPPSNPLRNIEERPENRPSDSNKELPVNSERVVRFQLKEGAIPIECYHTDNPQECQKAFKKLLVILNENCVDRDRLDSLSKNIVKWAGKCFSVGLGEKLDDPAALPRIQPEIRERLDELAREVLVDSLAGIPLKCPVKDGGYTWDAEVVKDFCENGTGISPLTNLPFPDPMFLHEFAQEMLEWSGSLVCPIPPRQDLMVSPLTVADVEDPRAATRQLALTAQTLGPVFRASVYSLLASTERTVAADQERSRRHQSEGERLVREAEETMQQHLVVVMAEKEKEIADYGAAVSKRIQNMQMDHLQEKQALEAKIAQLSQRVVKLESQVSQSQSIASSYRTEISELATKYRAREAEVKKIDGSSGSCGGGCCVM